MDISGLNLAGNAVSLPYIRANANQLQAGSKQGSAQRERGGGTSSRASSLSFKNQFQTSSSIREQVPVPLDMNKTYPRRKESSQRELTEPSTASSERSGTEFSTVKSTTGAQPIRMYRARMWSPEVENAFRYQLAGFRDIAEYLTMFPTPEVWPENGLVSCLRAKKTG